MNPEIKKIQLYGERCSGTNYLASLIIKNLSVKFLPTLTEMPYGWKHWFPMDILNGKIKDIDDILFLVIYRNPYDWLRSIHLHHFHCHPSLICDFPDFIRREWHCEKLGQEMMHERDPLSGLRFENVLKLRGAKIKYFQSLKNCVRNFHFLRYEDLKNNPDILKEVALKFGINLIQDNIINEENRFIGCKRCGWKFTPLVYTKILKEDLIFINNGLNWNLENSIGYYKNGEK